MCPLGPEKCFKSKSNSSKFLEYPHFDDNEGHIVGGFKGDWNLWSINENLCIVQVEGENWPLVQKLIPNSQR